MFDTFSYLNEKACGYVCISFIKVVFAGGNDGSQGAQSVLCPGISKMPYQSGVLIMSVGLLVALIIWLLLARKVLPTMVASSRILLHLGIRSILPRQHQKTTIKHHAQ